VGLRFVLPCLNEVPVGEVLGLVLGVGRAGPVNKVQVDVVDTEVLERGGNTLLNTVVPGVIELSGEPDLLAGHARVLDTGTDLGLVAVSKGSIDVTVALQQGILHSNPNLIGLGLPGTKANGGNLVTGVEGVSLSVEEKMLEIGVANEGFRRMAYLVCWFDILDVIEIELKIERGTEGR